MGLCHRGSFCGAGTGSGRQWGAWDSFVSVRVMVGCGLEGGDGEEACLPFMTQDREGVSASVADSPSTFRGTQIADVESLTSLP